jgi:hypothetical protein
LTWEIVITAILLAWFAGGLIAFLLNIGQFRQLDKKVRRFLIVVHIIGLIFFIYLAVNLAFKLTG